MKTIKGNRSAYKTKQAKTVSANLNSTETLLFVQSGLKKQDLQCKTELTLENSWSRCEQVGLI